MAVGNIFRLVVTTEVHGETTQNAWWYQQTSDNDSVANDASPLNAAFGSQYVAPMAALLGTDSEILTIETINYQTPTDYDLDSITTPGTALGTTLPSMWAVGVRMGRKSAGYNYPSKRFAGFTDAALDGNDIDVTFSNALMSIMNNLRTLTLSGRTWQWLAIRKSNSFMLGNPLVDDYYQVGAAIKTYESVQTTRRN